MALPRGTAGPGPKRRTLTPLAEMTTVEVWRELVARFDLARSVGPITTWRALRDDLAHARVRLARRRAAADAMWTEAAAEIGAEIDALAPGLFEIRKNGKSTRVLREKVMLNDAVSIEIAEDKALARRLVAETGLPVPDWREFEAANPHQAHSFLARKTPPFVIKPATGSGGRGITANVRSRPELRKATITAARFASCLLIERQAAGDVYRLFVLDGQVIDVVRCLPPRLTGDGASTVRQLLAAENRRRLADPFSFFGLPADLDCLLTLKAQGLELGSVPRPGTAFMVRTVTNHNGETDNETVEAPISEKLRADAASAAAVLGLRLAGLDIVTQELQGGLQESGGVVLEVNAVPALYHHYRVADHARTRNVAVPVLERLLE